MTAPIAPVTGSTPIYDLEYLIEGEPAYHFREKWERLAKRLEVLLQARALAPPDAVDLAAIAGRVAVVEGGAWTTLPLVGTATTLNHDSLSPPNCQYRVENRRVFLRGWTKAGTSGVAAGVPLWAALPAALRPTTTETVWPVRGSTLGVFRMDVASVDGRGFFPAVALPANEYLNLNTVSWPLA